MFIRFLKPLCVLCAIGTMSLSAQRSDAQTENQPQASQQTELNDHSKQCLAELEEAVDLSAGQKQEIHDVLLQGEAAQRATWKKFNRAQMSAIHLEAEMCAAMADRMTDSQKRAFSAARTSQNEKIAAETQASDTPRRFRETSDRSQTNKNDDRDPAERTRQRSSENATQEPDGKSLTPSESFVRTAIIAPMEQAVGSLDLNSEERAKCNTVCSAFHTKLNAVWNEIHTLHNELVTQELKTIHAVAKVLTKEQLLKLENRRTLAMKTETSRSSSSR